jgi:hypothetical protein
MSIDGILLTVLAVLVGLLAGFLRRGRLERVGHVRVRAKTLLLLGVVIPALADRFTRDVAVPLVVFGLACLFAFALRNVRLVGMSVMAIGILGNLLATFLNDGLPVGRHALVAAGLASPADVDRVELSGARRLEEPTHRLRFLGDIVPLPETGQVLSFGDLVILVGLADITANLTLRRRRATADEPDDLDDARDVLDEIERLLHTRRARPGARGPRPIPHHATPVVEEDEEGRRTVVLVGPGLEPDVEWFAPYPPRGTFWLDARPDAPTDAVVLDLPPVPVLAPPAPPAPPTVTAFVPEPDTVDLAPEPVVDLVDLTEPIDEPEPAPTPAPTPEPVIDLVEPIDEPAAPPEPVIDLARGPAIDPDPDALLAAIFLDLTPKKKARRRGARNIPDFEPIHLEDPISSAGR